MDEGLHVGVDERENTVTIIEVDFAGNIVNEREMSINQFKKTVFG